MDPLAKKKKQERLIAEEAEAGFSAQAGRYLAEAAKMSAGKETEVVTTAAAPTIFNECAVFRYLSCRGMWRIQPDAFLAFDHQPNSPAASS
jgi:hypothetical protein